MSNPQFKALLHTLKSYHNHLSIKDDKVKIEAWQDNGFHFVAISHIELYNERITYTYCHNEIHGQYDLTMID